MTYDEQNPKFIQSLFFEQIRDMGRRKANTEDLTRW